MFSSNSTDSNLVPLKYIFNEFSLAVASSKGTHMGLNSNCPGLIPAGKEPSTCG